MYGPASGGGGGRDGGDPGRGGGGRGRGERRMTARGQMSAGANQRPPLSDLPPHMKLMFEPRPPLEHKSKLVKRKMPPYTGIGQYLNLFELVQPEVAVVENVKDRKLRIREELQKANDEKNELLKADWDPQRNFKATENAYHTLFIGRLSYDTTEKKLRREFEQFGPVKTVKMVMDNDGKPRGYAFVEFENEKDMTQAYKQADGRKVDGRRILVDVERGRTVRNWFPRRFGGGLGGRKPKKSKKELKEDEEKRVRELAASRSAYERPPDRGPPRDDRRGGGNRSRSRDRGGGDRYGGGGGPRREDRGGDRDRGRGGGGDHYGPAPSSDRKRTRSRERGDDRGDERRRRRSRSPDHRDRRR